MYFYKNGNYVVQLYSDGTKIRTTENDEFIPSFSECCDVKITDYCDNGCKFCYEGCSLNGKHGELFNYPFLNTLHPYTELALNGNDLSHPDLEKFLFFLKGKKIVTNMTVNQNHFEKNYDKLLYWSKSRLIKGLGISLNNSNCNLDRIVNFPNSVIHVISGVFNQNDFDNLKDKNAKVLFLGYKKLGRGNNFYDINKVKIDNNISWLKNNIIDFPNHFEIISFDNLAIKQLSLKNKFSKSWEKYYMGDDGKYTFYIDLVKGVFAKNSLSPKRFPIGNLSIDEMFKIIQNENSD